MFDIAGVRRGLLCSACNVDLRSDGGCAGDAARDGPGREHQVLHGGAGWWVMCTELK